MADYELLELVLTMAIPRRDVKPLAKKLIAEFNDFSGVINAPAAALLEVDGVKENTLAMLKVIKAAAIRTSWQTLCAAEAPVIRSPDTLLEYCRTSMCHSDVEELRIILWMPNCRSSEKKQCSAAPSTRLPSILAKL